MICGGKLCSSSKLSRSSFLSVIFIILVLFTLVWYSTVSVKTKLSIQPTLSDEALDYTMISENVITIRTNETNRAHSQEDETILIDSAVAKAKLKGIRVFCWILSQEKNLQTKVAAVNSTWGRRCDGKIFVITTKKVIPEVVDLKVPDGRDHLTEKTIAAMKYLYTHYLNDFDWFLKADDDTYIIMENLKYLLSHYDSHSGIYLGHLFKKYSKWGYMSGGAGYVVSREAVRLVVEKGYNVKGKCSTTGKDEDVELGHCLHAVGITVHDTRDRFDRETFHPFGSKFHIVEKKPGGLAEWDRHPTRMGEDCCSQLTISFHYTDPGLMRIMEFLLYRTSVYGRRGHFDAMKDFF